MPLTPHCTQTDWLVRAAKALSEAKPDLSAAEVTAIALEHLWEEACDLSPEEAAAIYAAEHPE